MADGNDLADGGLGRELKSDSGDAAARRPMVLEAKTDGTGPVGTTWCRNGTLRAGDNFVVGQRSRQSFARCFDDSAEKGAEGPKAPPSTPVEIIGLGKEIGRQGGRSVRRKSRHARIGRPRISRTPPAGRKGRARRPRSPKSFRDVFAAQGWQEAVEDGGHEGN